MPSTFRIPRAELTGVLGAVLTRVARRTWGEVPDTAHVLFHHRRVLTAVLGHERRVAGWDALDAHLTTYAVMASAATIGCSWCLDLGYFLSRRDGLDVAKVRQVPRWRDAEVFTDLEREVMAYAEAISLTPPTVGDGQVASLRDALGDRAMVELTMMVALENRRSCFNAAVGLASQGFSDRCDLPPLSPLPPHSPPREAPDAVASRP